MDVVVAVLIGILTGLCVRPFLDAYLRFKTAELYRDAPMRDASEGWTEHR